MSLQSILPSQRTSHGSPPPPPGRAPHAFGLGAAPVQKAPFDCLQLQAMFDQAPGFMALLSGPGHRFELANPAYRRLVGRDVVGLEARQALPEAAQQAFLEQLDRVYRQGQAYVAEGQHVELRDDGTGETRTRCLDFVYQPLRSADGAVCGVFVQGHDVTQQCEAAEGLAETARMLAQVACEKDAFLATLAHELRNPLAPVVGVAAVLQGMAATAGGPLGRLASVLRRQARHMTQMIDDLLDASRAGRGSLHLHIARVDLREVAATAVEQVAPLMERSRHRLTVELASEPLLVDGDGARLVQVVANMLNNAARYTPPGGQVWLRIDHAAGEARIRVSDTGEGISAAFLPQVFDQFKQAAPGAARSQGGLGLGLALVRSLVELHGGTVEAGSEGAGCGSEFTVRIPAAIAT